ncbi:phage Gp37/Gp68 family protein [Agrobacterium vitis]|uniref:phage Gp37/Gp68 family protein n=1 Tax=Allorhizobium ampelinum TaxID=3025782 RepID=UPI001F1766E8|nr:phage Gp37/Gp68 family protein [Allorhizobium ampelinum]MCF1470574.1 phage Gp37/Gp68 family protein [Allorhizobium ampelinum]
MADNTKIEWTDATWNPITGCSVVSPGCTNCYAMRLAGTRLQHHPSRAGLTTESKAGPAWNGVVRFNEEWLTQPLRWKKPRTIFVCAHGDLFDEGVPDEWIDQVFAVMARAPHHTFQVLTKRPERMRDYLRDQMVCSRIGAQQRKIDDDTTAYTNIGIDAPFPLPNVWLGVSVEDQRRADERIPILLETPAAIRWISAEPLLGPIDWKRWLPTVQRAERPDGRGQHIASWFYLAKCEHCTWIGSSDLCRIDSLGDDSGIFCPSCDRPICGNDLPNLHWVVAGGESGAGARPMHPDWVRSIRDQCAAANVPFLFKQWGEWSTAATMFHEGVNLHPDWTGATYAGPNGSILPLPSRPIGEFDVFYKTGKKASGRLLDGIEHDGYPRGKP